MDNSFETHIIPEQLSILSSLTNPYQIQLFLDQTPYSADDLNRTPVEVMQDRVAHCLDGAIFAAAALRRLGFPPLLLDMFPDPGMDDDHVLAVFRINGYFGAVAKSNFPGLRFREPVFRSIRELVLSYFESFFNVDGVKTLRSYTRLIDLSQFDHLDWIFNRKGVDTIEHRLLTLHRKPLITEEMASNLNPVDPLSYKAGTIGVNPDGLYKPVRKVGGFSV
jgi:hypothetical protein